MKRADTLYITDLDGTLLNNDSLVSERSSEIINDAVDRGALFTVATARTPATVDPLLASTATSMPAIVMTGAALWNRSTHSYEDIHVISPELSNRIMDEFRAQSIVPFRYALAPDGVIDVFHLSETNSDYNHLSKIEKSFIDMRSHLPLKRIHYNLFPGAEQLPTLLFIALGPCANIMAIASRLEADNAGSVSAYPDNLRKDIGVLEVFAPGVSKAEAVLKMKQTSGADRLVVFGDNLNDISMLRAADVGVAVENALPEVKSAADIVIGANSTDAVARFIYEDFTGSPYI